MTNEELKNLKDGDIVRLAPHGRFRPYDGDTYIVLRNVGGAPVVVRAMKLHSASKWEVLPPAPTSISLVEKITELEKLGWTFNENIDFWTSPDGKFKTNSLRHAWESRNNYCKVFKVGFPTPLERRAELHAAGWSNRYGITWASPSGKCFDSSLEAWVEMKKSV